MTQGIPCSSCISGAAVVILLLISLLTLVTFSKHMLIWRLNTPTCDRWQGYSISQKKQNMAAYVFILARVG